MQKRMTGKFYPTPDEIVDDLYSLSPTAIVLYFSLTMRHYIEDYTTSDDGWVTGKVKSKQKAIIEKSSLSRPTYYKALKELIESGFVKIEDGEFLIIKLKRIESKAETEKQVEVIENRITRNILKVIMKEIRDLYDLHEQEFEEENQMVLNLEEKLLKNLTENQQKEDKVLKNFTKKHENNQKDSGLGVKNFNKSVKNFNKNVQKSLHYDTAASTRSIERIDHVCVQDQDLVRTFYGDQKISKTKHTHTLKIIKELKEQGYTIHDIAFAVKYTLEIKKMEPRDFSIIEHTIGEALQYRKEYDEKEKRKAENEIERVRQEEEKQKSTEEADRFRSLKEKMLPEEREKLRKKAIKLSDERKLPAAFITDGAIEALENEILRKEDPVNDDF